MIEALARPAVDDLHKHEARDSTMAHRLSAAACMDAAASDDVEAWGIAVDLIADLGAQDAMAWALGYINDLEDDNRPKAMARWRLVTDALAELT